MEEEIFLEDHADFEKPFAKVRGQEETEQ